MEKTKVDISSENFDYYFGNGIKNLSVQEKSEIPRDIAFSLFRNSGVIKPDAFHKVNLLSRIYVLWKILKRRFFIVFEDHQNGMTEGEFLQFKKGLKDKDYSQEQCKYLKAPAVFVLANKELSDTFSYLNRLSHSHAYNYLNKIKGISPNKIEQWKDETNYIIKLLSHYESNRKKMVVSAGLEMGEWLVLTYLYHGNAMPSSPIHKQVYRYSYNSSQTKIKLAFRTLQHRGYIEKIGGTSNTQLRITPLGRQLVNELFTKFVAI